jgi:hypothetical protein
MAASFNKQTAGPAGPQPIIKLLLVGELKKASVFFDGQ